MRCALCVALAVLLIPHNGGGFAGEVSQLTIRNAQILTMGTPARADAFAVRDGKFLAVGTWEEVEKSRGAETTVVDLGGKAVVPGFIDAHTHPSPIYDEDSPWASVKLGPERVRTIDDLIGALKRKAAITPEGQWVTGSRYQDTKLGRHPTRHDLDRASERHPIIISHSSGHVSACNSLALRLANVTRETQDPSGGRFVRDENGEPTGVVQERAASLVRDAGPNRVEPPASETIEGYRRCYREFISNGLTSVHVAGTSTRSAELLTTARSAKEPLRLYVMLREGSREEAKSRLEGQVSSSVDVRYGAIKLFHGNSLSGQTCWLSKPYANRPDYYGIPPARSQTELNKLILSVHEAGLQACVHSNGDREIDMLLTAFEEALKKHPRSDHRHRIEHCSVVTPEILQRMKRLDLVMVPHSYFYEHGDKLEAYGKQRWDWMLASRSAIDLGIPIAGNSDYSVSACRPLLQIEGMVTRTSAEGKVYGAKQCTTVEQALYAWTMGSAFAEFQETLKGSIVPGKLADFVVLSADPTTFQAHEIKDIVVEATYIGGEKVFERSAAN